MKSNYAILAALILLVEIGIALWVNDGFIRPYLGDYLVTILIYCLVMSTKVFSWKNSLLYTLVFCYAVEVAQYFNVISWLGLEKNAFARIIIGTSFSWADMLCYTLAAITIYVIESYRKKASSNDKSHQYLN